MWKRCVVLLLYIHITQCSTVQYCTVSTIQKTVANAVANVYDIIARVRGFVVPMSLVRALKSGDANELPTNVGHAESEKSEESEARARFTANVLWYVHFQYGCSTYDP
jgi:hypothetical protein